MNTWLSNIGIGRNVIAPAAPAGVTNMRNGASLVAGFGELGGNPLLHTTTVEMAAFDMIFAAAAVPQLYMSPVSRTTIIGDVGFLNGFNVFINDIATLFSVQEPGADYLQIDPIGSNFLFGNSSVSTFLQINPTAQRTQIFDNSTAYMDIDAAAQQYIFGDPLQGNFFMSASEADIYTGATSATALKLNNTGGIFQMGDIDLANNSSTVNIYDNIPQVDINAGNVLFSINESSGRATITNTALAATFMEIDYNTGNFNFGDVSALGSGMMLYIDDSNQEILLGDANGTGSGINFYIDFGGITSTFQMYDNLGTYFFIGNNSGGIAPHLFQLGDGAGGPAKNNGSRISIDDQANTLSIANTANNLGIVINGTPGFTGTVTPVTSITVDNGIVTNVA